MCRRTAGLLFSGQTCFLTECASAFNFSRPARNDRSCINLRLSSHLSAKKTPGIHDGGPFDDPDDSLLRRGFNNHCKNFQRCATAFVAYCFLTGANTIQSDLLLHWSQRINHKANVFIELYFQLSNTLSYVITVHGARKGFVFQFLFY